MINENDMVTQTVHKQRFYAFCGIIAPIFFWFMVIVESFLRPGFNHIYFVYSEEPGLAERFGNEYTEYKKNVPRWIPRLTPWEKNKNTEYNL
jgi:protein-S-isoprenylcysteine O-methyltransferase Ste14